MEKNKPKILEVLNRSKWNSSTLRLVFINSAARQTMTLKSSNKTLHTWGKGYNVKAWKCNSFTFTIYIYIHSENETVSQYLHIIFSVGQVVDDGSDVISKDSEDSPSPPSQLTLPN